MASRCSAGDVRSRVAARAIFDIPLGGVTMSIRRASPISLEMVNRFGLLLLMARCAERIEVMATLTLEFFPFGIDTMIPAIIKFMHISGQIIIGMALAAEILCQMAWTAIPGLGIGIKFMLVPPTLRMD